jgi:hypothetical protein
VSQTVNMHVLSGHSSGGAGLTVALLLRSAIWWCCGSCMWRGALLHSHGGALRSCPGLPAIRR